MTDTLVLYHGSCPDGFTAAWAAYKKFGRGAKYLAVNFHDEELPDVTDKDVYIVDFSYDRHVLLDMIERARSLTVLDHHRSAEKKLAGLPNCHFDMDRSGAGMTWDFFHGRETRPLLVSYVEDRDIWNWKLAHSKEINAVITSHEFTFDNWNMLQDQIENSITQVLVEGRAIRRSKEAYVRVMRRQAQTMPSFLGWENIPVVNAPHITISELVHSLVGDAPFACGWRYSPDGKFIYSLRSEGDFDVSVVAGILGGGGHKNASGFDSPFGPWALCDMDNVREDYEKTMASDDNPADVMEQVASPEDDIASAVAALKRSAADNLVVNGKSVPRSELKDD